MPGVDAHNGGAWCPSDDRCLSGLRLVTGALAGLGLLAAAVLPFTTDTSHPAARRAQSAASTGVPKALVVAPQDLARADEWWLNLIHGAKAAKSTKGSGVTVAVLDTGVDAKQQDLAGRVVQGPDYTSTSRQPGGKHWGLHGTQMASIIAGRGHGAKSASGVLGVAPDVKILSVRVTLENDDPQRKNQALMNQSRDAVAKGIRYAVDHGADVINMSLGGGNTSYNGGGADEDAVKYALAKGVVLVASMGNDGAAPGKRYFPAAYPGVIAVGTVDRKFKPWQGSNRGDYVSVSAPGVNIACAGPGATYVEVSGTSPSTAIVSGVAALIKARYPQFTPAQVKLALEKGVTHQPPGGRNDKIGVGVIDAAKALSSAATQGPDVARPEILVSPQPPTKPQVHDSSVNSLLIGILGGGGALIAIGLALGWVQRRRPEDPEPELRVVEVRSAGPRTPMLGDARAWPPDTEPASTGPRRALLGAPVPEAGPAAELFAATEPFSMVDSFATEDAETSGRVAPEALRPYQVPVSIGQNGNGNGHGRPSIAKPDFQIDPPARPAHPYGEPPAERYSNDPLGGGFGDEPQPGAPNGSPDQRPGGPYHLPEQRPGTPRPGSGTPFDPPPTQGRRPEPGGPPDEDGRSPWR